MDPVSSPWMIADAREGSEELLDKKGK